MTPEINLMDAGTDWLEAHTLATEGSTNDSDSSAPAYVTAFGDTARRPSSTVSQFGQPASIAASALSVKGCGHSLLQRLVRTVMVIVANKTRSSLLLAPRRGCRRRSRFGLIHSTHLSMTRVVLGSSPARKLHPNPQSQPPSREARQIQSPVPSEGLAMIDANDFRLTKLDKQSLKILPYWLIVMVKQSDAQQIAAEQIAHCQWVHPLPVSRAKPAFEIDGPDVIGSAWDRQWRSHQLGSPTCAGTTAAYKSQPPQPFGYGSHLGQVGARMLSAQMGINFLCAPTRTALPHPADLSEPATGSPSWRAVGTSRAIRQSGATLRSKTSQPFEPSLSTDTKLTAKLSNRMDATPRRLNKALTRFQ